MSFSLPFVILYKVRFLIKDKQQKTDKLNNGTANKNESCARKKVNLHMIDIE